MIQVVDRTQAGAAGGGLVLPMRSVRRLYREAGALVGTFAAAPAASLPAVCAGPCGGRSVAGAVKAPRGSGGLGGASFCTLPGNSQRRASYLSAGRRSGLCGAVLAVLARAVACGAAVETSMVTCLLFEGRLRSGLYAGDKWLDRSRSVIRAVNRTQAGAAGGGLEALPARSVRRLCRRAGACGGPFAAAPFAVSIPAGRAGPLPGYSQRRVSGWSGGRRGSGFCCACRSGRSVGWRRGVCADDLKRRTSGLPGAGRRSAIGSRHPVAATGGGLVLPARFLRWLYREAGA